MISLRLQGGKSDVWVAAVISARRQHDMFVMEPILVRVIRCLALAGTKTITRSTAHAKAVNILEVTKYVYQADTRH